jgi:ribokinase
MTAAHPTGPRIAVLGSINMDLVAGAERLPAPGETVLGNSFATVPGGKGSNQAIAAARAGGDVRFIGAVGSDPFADQLAATLAGAGWAPNCCGGCPAPAASR